MPRFDNTIIIMTSNIGFKNSEIGFNNDNYNRVYSKAKELLGIEFINRIDKFFVFNDLKKQDIKKIIHKKIKETLNTFEILDTNFIISKEVINKLIDYSGFKDFGARKVDKVIKEKIYDIIIEEKLKKNDIITIETI